MLPDRAARALPLILLALLAGLALLLDRATYLPDIANGLRDKAPDLRIKDFRATAYGMDGKPLYVLTAEQMQHYPHDDHSELSQAHLIRTLPGEPDLQVHADKARMASGAQQVHFEQNVRMLRDAAPDLPAMQLSTSRLTLDTQRGSAQSDAPTQLLHGGDRLNTTGFDYDHRQARLALRAKVKIRYAPPQR
ncbi:LPS export ABC transporter periplasmic protein LptC [Chitinimonas sp. BJYL2]|uniref:LPS export ABC transporter periplasmic protein LptC n=1 Tax=Chitinimonas sp. BJYL2 TaxID=2976696 RepID=UPI0022B4FAC1|nr:LPS export ABC transporter periplasmic protein LptC [Chitinimonas sp. BJYL2]